MITSSQLHSVSSAWVNVTSVSSRPLHLRKFFGAWMSARLTAILSVYQTPALAISNQWQSSATMFLLYHSGYFHLNMLPYRFISRLSLSGDSPSSNIVSYISRFFPMKRALSPVRNSCLIIFFSFFLSISFIFLLYILYYIIGLLSPCYHFWQMRI